MEAQQLTCHDKAVFQHFYSKLVNILPMDNATFMAELYKSGLLPGDLKSLISVQDTQKKKSAYFLDNAIKPSVTSDVGTSFSKLLTVMENCYEFFGPPGPKNVARFGPTHSFLVRRYYFSGPQVHTVAIARLASYLAKR